LILVAIFKKEKHISRVVGEALTPIEYSLNTGPACGESTNEMGGGYLNGFYAREFWRFVMVQQYVGKLAMTAIDYPPMQAPVSFNLTAIKAKIDEAIKQHEGE